MPINPDPSTPGGFIVDFRDRHGQRQRLRRASREQSDHLLLDAAGGKSARDLAGVQIESACTWYIARHKSRLSGDDSVVPAMNRMAATFAGRSVSSIRTEEMALFRSRLTTIAGLKKTSVAQHMGLIAQMFDELRARRCLRNNPARLASKGIYVKSRRGRRRRSPSHAELAAIRSRASTEELLAVDLAAEASIGLAEGDALEHDCIDFSRRVLLIKSLISPSDKTLKLERLPGRRREVPISDRLRATLLRAKVVQRLAAQRRGEPMPKRVHDCFIGASRQFAKIQLRLGMNKLALLVRRRRQSKASLERRRQLFGQACYSAKEVARCAVLGWIKDGVTGKEIARRLGLVSTRAVYRDYGKELNSRPKRQFIPLIAIGMDRLRAISEADGDNRHD